MILFSILGKGDLPYLILHFPQCPSATRRRKLTFEINIYVSVTSIYHTSGKGQIFILYLTFSQRPFTSRQGKFIIKLIFIRSPTPILHTLRNITYADTTIRVSALVGQYRHTVHLHLTQR